MAMGDLISLQVDNLTLPYLPNVTGTFDGREARRAGGATVASIAIRGFMNILVILIVAFGVCILSALGLEKFIEALWGK